MLNCIIATMRPNSGMKAPRTPTSFISRSARSGLLWPRSRSRKMRLASRSRREARRRSATRLAAIRRSASGWIGMSLVSASSNRRRMLTGSLSEGGLVGEVEAAVLDAGSRAPVGSLPKAKTVRIFSPRLGLGLTWRASRRGEEDAGEVADVLGVEEVVLHEALDRALALGRPVAEGRGDLDLGVEGRAARSPARSGGAGGRGWSRGRPRPRRRCGTRRRVKHARSATRSSGVSAWFRYLPIQNRVCRSRRPPLPSLTLGSSR